MSLLLLFLPSLMTGLQGRTPTSIRGVCMSAWATWWCPAPLARGRVAMCAEQPHSTSADVNVEPAAETLKAIKAAEQQRKMDIIFNSPPPIEGATSMDGTEGQSTSELSYLTARDELVGTLDSSALLNLDEHNGLWPKHLDQKTDRNMLWVDELSCVGCRSWTRPSSAVRSQQLWRREAMTLTPLRLSKSLRCGCGKGMCGFATCSGCGARRRWSHSV